MKIDVESIEYDFGGAPYISLDKGIEMEVIGFHILRWSPPMEKYRIRILIDRLDKPGTDTAEVHVGNVHVASITPIVELAKQLTAHFGTLDEAAKCPR